MAKRAKRRRRVLSVDYFRREGRRGGKASARGRMVKLSAEQRSELARRAARARWDRAKKKPPG